MRTSVAEATRSYRSALLRAGYFREGKTVDDLDSIIVDLVEAKKKFERAERCAKNYYLTETKKTMLERSRMVVRGSEPPPPETDELTLEKIRDAFAGSPRIFIRDIAIEVAKRHGLTVKDLQSVRRHKDYVTARHEAFYFARELTDASLPAIGRFFGDRDHTTVLWGIKKHKERAGITDENHA